MSSNSVFFVSWSDTVALNALNASDLALWTLLACSDSFRFCLCSFLMIFFLEDELPLVLYKVFNSFLSALSPLRTASFFKPISRCTRFVNALSLCNLSSLLRIQSSSACEGGGGGREDDGGGGGGDDTVAAASFTLD